MKKLCAQVVVRQNYVHKLLIEKKKATHIYDHTEKLCEKNILDKKLYQKLLKQPGFLAGQHPD
jgi:hypothetical protein